MQRVMRLAFWWLVLVTTFYALELPQRASTLTLSDFLVLIFLFIGIGILWPKEGRR